MPAKRMPPVSRTISRFTGKSAARTKSRIAISGAANHGHVRGGVLEADGDEGGGNQMPTILTASCAVRPSFTSQYLRSSAKITPPSKIQVKRRQRSWGC